MNNDEFYAKADALCARLRQAGLEADARVISHRLHEVAWTTTVELFDELQRVFEALLASERATRLPRELQDEVRSYIRLLDG